MVGKIGGTRNLAWWKAWYGLEPRGEHRQDWHTVLKVLQGAKEGTTLDDVLNMLHDFWHPVDKDEKQRRKELKRRRAMKRLREYGKECAKRQQEVERGKQQRRNVVSPDRD